MPDEKRMIQDYEVKNAIHIGGKEVILAEDLTSNEPYMVCDCRWDNPLSIDVYEKAVAGADYLEAMETFLDRVSSEVEKIKGLRAERGVTSEPLTTGDCIPGSTSSHYEGQLVVIRPESMNASARSADMQLLLATGGNGCNPDARGQAVFCKNLFTGKTVRWDRTDVAGIIQPERMPEWAQQKLQEMGIAPDNAAPAKVYMGSLEEAKQNGETALFHKSMELNTACAKGIEQAIHDNSKDSRSFDLAAAHKTVVAEFGAERMNVVLASTLNRKDWDGRFSQVHREWGKGIELPRHTPQQHAYYVCEAHPAVLDGFIKHARKAQQEKEKRPSVADALKKHPTQTKPAAAKKKAKNREEGR